MVNVQIIHIIHNWEVQKVFYLLKPSAFYKHYFIVCHFYNKTLMEDMLANQFVFHERKKQFSNLSVGFTTIHHQHNKFNLITDLQLNQAFADVENVIWYLPHTLTEYCVDMVCEWNSLTLKYLISFLIYGSFTSCKAFSSLHCHGNVCYISQIYNNNSQVISTTSSSTFN